MGLFSKQDSPGLIYQTIYLGFWIKIFNDRIEFKNSVGSKNIPIDQIASVNLPMIGTWQVTIETTGGEKYKIPTRKKKEVKEAIYKAKNANNQNTGNTYSSSEELERLFKLKEKGAISEDEYQNAKKKII